MDQHTQERDERRPLLDHDAVADSDSSPAVTNPVLQDAAIAKVLRVAIPGILIIMSLEFAMEFITVAFSQLMEGAICVTKYPEVKDAYNDPICKNDDVQTMLAFVRAWEFSLAIVPGFLTAIPYGMVADKYGPKFVLMLVFLGNVTSLGLETMVCLQPDVYDVRWVWAFCLLTVIGGGSIGWEAMKYTVADAVSGEKQRTTTFFYVDAVSMATRLSGGPLVYLTMKRGPIVTQSIGLGLMALGFLLSFALPDARKSKDSSGSHSDHHPMQVGFRGHVSSVALKVKHIFQDLFWNNWKLGFLLFSQLCTTIGNQEVAIRLQYVTKRYGWTWGEAGLLSTISGIIDVALIALILPAISQLLLQKLQYTAFNKDVWLVRASVIVMVLGSFATGLAPATPWLIFGVAIYSLSRGYGPAVASLIASVAHNQHSGLIYVCIAMMKAIGAFVAGPSLAAAFGIGLRWGGTWQGLPFFYACTLQFVAAIIVFSIRHERQPVHGD